jgi:hypothetical protein
MERSGSGLKANAQLHTPSTELNRAALNNPIPKTQIDGPTGQEALEAGTALSWTAPSQESSYLTAATMEAEAAGE